MENLNSFLTSDVIEEAVTLIDDDSDDPRWLSEVYDHNYPANLAPVADIIVSFGSQDHNLINNKTIHLEIRNLQRTDLNYSSSLVTNTSQENVSSSTGTEFISSNRNKSKDADMPSVDCAGICTDKENAAKVVSNENSMNDSPSQDFGCPRLTIYDGKFIPEGQSAEKTGIQNVEKLDVGVHMVPDKNKKQFNTEIKHLQRLVDVNDSSFLVSNRFQENDSSNGTNAVFIINRNKSKGVDMPSLLSEDENIEQKMQIVSDNCEVICTDLENAAKAVANENNIKINENQSKNFEMPILTIEDQNAKLEAQSAEKKSVPNEVKNNVGIQMVPDDNEKKNINFPRLKITAHRKVEKFPGKMAAMKKQQIEKSDDFVYKTTPPVLLPRYNTDNYEQQSSRCNESQNYPEISVSRIFEDIANNLISIIPSLQNFITINNQSQAKSDVQHAWNHFEHVKYQCFDILYQPSLYLIENLNNAMFCYRLMKCMVTRAKHMGIWYVVNTQKCIELLIEELMVWTQKKQSWEKNSNRVSFRSHIVNPDVGNSIFPRNRPLNANRNMGQHNTPTLQPATFENHDLAMLQRLAFMPSVLHPDHKLLKHTQLHSQNQKFLRSEQRYITRRAQDEIHPNYEMLQDTSEERSSSRDNGFNSPRCDERTMEQTDDHGFAAALRTIPPAATVSPTRFTHLPPGNNRAPLQH